MRKVRGGFWRVLWRRACFKKKNRKLWGFLCLGFWEVKQCCGPVLPGKMSEFWPLSLIISSQTLCLDTPPHPVPCSYGATASAHTAASPAIASTGRAQHGSTARLARPGGNQTPLGMAVVLGWGPSCSTEPHGASSPPNPMEHPLH